MKKKSLLLLLLMSFMVYGCGMGLEKVDNNIDNTVQDNVTILYQINEGEEQLFEDNHTKTLVDDLFANKMFIEYINNHFATGTAFTISQIGGVNLDDQTWGSQFEINKDLVVYTRTSGKFETFYSSGYVSVCDKDNKFYQELETGSGEKAFTCDGDTGEYQENIANQEFIHDAIIGIVIENKTTGEKVVIQGPDSEWLEKMQEMMPVGG